MLPCALYSIIPFPLGRELWRDIREYSGYDPLEPWLKLVKHVQENMIGGSKAELQKTLETCTKELLRTNKYESDVRFLRLWIQYADCLPDPADIFIFLKVSLCLIVFPALKGQDAQITQTHINRRGR